MSTDQAISEDNTIKVPKYLLEVSDNYGNKFRSVTAEDQ